MVYIFPDWLFPITVSLLAAILTGVGIFFFRQVLLHCQVMDHPKERSSHRIPTPRGAGVVMMAIVFIMAMGLYFAGIVISQELLWILGMAVVLCLVSFLDDIWSLSVRYRFGVQLIAVSVCTWYFYSHYPDFTLFNNILPRHWDMVFCGLGWLWFVNLYNFMDGIDGITAIESIFLCMGLILIDALVELSPGIILLSWIVIGAMIAFLFWNWHPAKIFIGDAGSISFGFLFGGGLIYLSANGHTIPAGLLAMYYLCDSMATLGFRLLRREKVWEAHNSHFFHKAIRRGFSHSKVVSIIAYANVCLLVMAVLASVYPEFRWPFVLVGFVLIYCVFRYFQGDYKFWRP